MAEQPPVVAQQLVQQLLVLAELPHSSWLYFMMISMLSVLYGIPAYRCEEPVRNDLYTLYFNVYHTQIFGMPFTDNDFINVDNGLNDIITSLNMV